MQRGDGSTSMYNQRRALGLLSVLVLVLVSACETVSLDEPLDAAVAARSDEAAVTSELRADKAAPAVLAARAAVTRYSPG